MEECAAFALLVGSIVDATTVASTPAAPRTPASVTFDGIGTPPLPSGAIVARSFANGGFVLSFAAGDIAVDDPSSSGASPKHLSGAFDVHFTISADGYADLPAMYACNKDALPIVPAPYVLRPNPTAIAGRVTSGGSAVAGAKVQVTAATPPATLPAAVFTDANGLYGIAGVPAAQTVTVVATKGGSSSQTVALDYPGPPATVNFAL
jgi:hypothetical protein